MRRFLVGLLALIGVLSILVVAGAVGLVWWLTRPDSRPVPQMALLTLDLRRPIEEGQPSLAANLLGGQDSYQLLDLVRMLGRAAHDPRIKALYVRLDETPHGFATTQELRHAIAEVRKAGKRTVVFADSLGELTPANESYYLASAFERIVLQPAGSVGLTGLALQEPFAKGLLAKLGIGFEVARRSEYKTALDFLADREPSAAHREMSEALLSSLDGQFRTGIEAARPALAGKLGPLIDAGPYTAQAALDAGLIDRLAYQDVLLNELVSGQGQDAADGSAPVLQRIDFDQYASSASSEPKPKARIALIEAIGPIVRGSAEFENGMVAADDLAAALATARRADDIKAVLFRIASPGGSAVASETIGHEVDRLRQAGKPVVVSMGDVAGSGGYWIAANADVIIADAATLTGSIGVIAGKPVLQDLWSWLEVNWVTTSRGAHADIASLNKPYSAEERAKVDHAVDAIYQAFKNRVAAGRHLSEAAVEKVARGRVWTGEQAVDAGLVDGVGGLTDAILVAKERIGLARGDQVELVAIPGPDTGLRHLLARLGRRMRGASVVLDRLAGVLAGQSSIATMTAPSVR